MNPIEKKIAEKLVKAILARGYEITIWEGEDFAIRGSVDRTAIMAALASTEMDSVIVRTVDGRRLGSIDLIWGNGEDLISDHSGNDTINALVAEVGA